MRVNNNKKIRRAYSLEQKKEVINYKDKNPGRTIRWISLKFQIPAGTVHEIIKKKDKILATKQQGTKISENRKSKQIEEPLYDWFVKQKSLYKKGKVSLNIGIKADYNKYTVSDKNGHVKNGPT